jgi:hypothetical protein
MAHHNPEGEKPSSLLRPVSLTTSPAASSSCLYKLNEHGSGGQANEFVHSLAIGKRNDCGQGPHAELIGHVPALVRVELGENNLAVLLLHFTFKRRRQRPTSCVGGVSRETATRAR